MCINRYERTQFETVGCSNTFVVYNKTEGLIVLQLKFRTSLLKIIQSFIPFYLFLVISAVGISVPSIFCILKFLLIQGYLKSRSLIGLLLSLYSL